LGGALLANLLVERLTPPSRPSLGSGFFNHPAFEQERERLGQPVSRNLFFVGWGAEV
jgi:hypothetical protein